MSGVSYSSLMIGRWHPWVAAPVTACLSPAMRQVITLLVQHPHFQVAIMSGRTLADLQRHVDGQVPYLAGNHGLEITGLQAIYCHPDARRLRPELVAMAQSLHHHLRNRASVWVEDKGLTLTVHVRGVPPQAGGRCRSRSYAWYARLSRHDGLRSARERRGGSPTTRTVGQMGGRALAGGAQARRAASDVPAGHLYW
jgi:trehalose-6-phosphatase